MKVSRSHLTIGSVGAVLALVIGIFQVRGYLREDMDRRILEAQWHKDMEARVCKLEGGEVWRGECRRRRR